MSSHSPSCPEGASRQAVPPLSSGEVGGTLLVTSGLLCVALVAVLDHHTTSRFSFSLFYLIPVAACAWWGGFSCGVFLALAATVAWHSVDSTLDPTIHLTVLTWNGVVRFCTLTLVASLVARLHAGIRREQLLARTDPLTG